MNTIKYIWAILIIPIICIYFQTINFEYTIDDHNLIVEKVSGKINHLSELSSFFETNYNNRDYRPITMISFGVENLIVGSLNPQVSHGVNILLFFVILIGLFFLFKRVFNVESNDSSKNVIFFATLLFACHPLCVEVVSSIKSRDGLLSMLFTLISMHLYIYFLFKKRLIFLFPTLLFLLIALMSKLDALGSVLFIPALYFYQNGFDKKSLKRGGVVIFCLLFTWIIFNGVKSENDHMIDEDTKVGIVVFTENNMYEQGGLLNKIGFAAQTHAIYFSKILIPINLRYYYGYAYYKLETFWNFRIWLLLISHFIILFLLLKFYRSHPIIMIGLMAYVSFIAYALNFVTAVAGVVADRYIFMALPWILLVFVLLLELILKKYNTYKVFNPFMLTTVLILGILSYDRATAWKSDLNLIERDAPFLESSYEGMRIAANVYKEASDKTKSKYLKSKYLDKAISCAQKANFVYPENVLMNLYEGSYHFAKNNINEAIRSFKKAWKVDSTHVDVNAFLGDSYYTLSDLDRALKHYIIAHTNAPKDYILINNIGTIYYEKGEIEKSFQFSQSIIHNDSSNIAAWENLGYFYLAEKDTAKAIEYFSKAVKLGMPLGMIPIEF
jgi:tetratricopeptide (TPR) repeat protein